MELTSLINKLKSKRELKDIDEKFIEIRINDYLTRNKVDLGNEKSKSYRLMFKSLRKQLREVYGVFRKVKEERSLGFYKDIFDEFKPKSIIDLGCGLESLRYATGYKLKYYCYDINKQEINKINEFFKKNRINGKAFVFNLADNNLDNLPKADLCLILKLLESLEAVKKGISKNLLNKVKSKVIIVSFSKVALGKKVKIRKSGRSWFRIVLRELGYDYKISDSEDEIFFIIRK